MRALYHLLLALGSVATSAAEVTRGTRASLNARQLVARIAAGELAPLEPYQQLVPGNVLSSKSNVNYRLVEEIPASSTSQVSGRVRLVDIDSGSTHHMYRRSGAIGRGAYGELWRAVRVSADGQTVETGSYVLKRLLPHRLLAQLSGYREVYFGLHDKLAGRAHVARFVEHFTRTVAAHTASELQEEGKGAASVDITELWLVFRDEGVSLHKLLYSAVGSTFAAATLEPSPLWVRLHTQPSAGRVFTRNVIRQLLHGLATCHRAGVVHRDVKPSNILAATEDGSLRVRLADFGSAVDEYATEHLYPNGKPTSDEVTLAYAPPEVTLSPSQQPYDPARPASFDMFSLGMTIAETVLGTPASELVAPSGSTLRDVLRQQRGGRGYHPLGGAGGASGHGGTAHGDVAQDTDGEEDGEGRLQHAAVTAGLAKLCIAPARTHVNVDAPWLHAGPPHHHHHMHNRQPRDGPVDAGDKGGHPAESSSSTSATVVTCDLRGFRRVWRLAERWARRRAHAAAGTTTKAVATRAPGHLSAQANGAHAPSQDGDLDAAQDTALVVHADGSTGVAVAGAGPRQLAVLPPPPILGEQLRAVVTVFDGYALLGSALPAPLSHVPSEPPPSGMVLVPVAPAAEPSEGSGATVCPLAEETSDPEQCTNVDAVGIPQAAGAHMPVPVEVVPSPLLGEDGEELLWRLLSWDPAARPDTAEALTLLRE